MHRNDILSIVALVAGIGSLATDATFSTQLTAIFGQNSKDILGGIGLAGMLASQIIRVLSVPAGSAPPNPPPPPKGA